MERGHECRFDGAGAEKTTRPQLVQKTRFVSFGP
jgi:hypothetical protein